MPAQLKPEFAQSLATARREHSFPLDVRAAAQDFSGKALALLFPHFGAGPATAIDSDAAEVGAALEKLIASLARCAELPEPGVSQRFFDALPAVHALLRSDAEAIFHGDPAARSVDEVILTYPGFYAIAIYRLAHALHALKVPLLPRLMTEHAHAQTGVDIHPGATIGRGFMIDHGTGVVIGETCRIGNGVKLYQGVTLGALVVDKRLANEQRHPTLEDHVVVYSNATILGGSTVIGHDAVVGGNAWVTSSVPPFSMVSHETEVRPRRDRGPDDTDFHI